LEKEKMQGTERKTENLKLKKKKKWIGKNKNWKRGGIERKRERRSEREGELKPRKWKREKKSERGGEEE
jgi:hypothetical protein